MSDDDLRAMVAAAITPDMIRTGVETLLLCIDQDEMHESTVQLIFIDMVRAIQGDLTPRTIVQVVDRR